MRWPGRSHSPGVIKSQPLDQLTGDETHEPTSFTTTEPTSTRKCGSTSASAHISEKVAVEVVVVLLAVASVAVVAALVLAHFVFHLGSTYCKL